MTPSACLLLTAASLLPALPPGDAARQDREKLQGPWKVLSIEHEGKKTPAKKVAGLRVTVTGDKMTSQDGKDVLEESTFRLDVVPGRRGIDLSFTAGPDKGKSARGIFRLEGATLTICVAEPDKERPKEFKAASGSGHTLFVLERVKP